MAYDSARDRVVLFGGTAVEGGSDVYYYGETWEWDGQAWEQRGTTAPFGRY